MNCRACSHEWLPAQVQVQLVSTAANMSSPASLVSRAQAINNQLEQKVSTFNTQVTQLNNGFEQEFGVLAKPLAKLSLRLGVPANALENNLQSARARSHKRCQLSDVKTPEPDKRCPQSDQHRSQLAEQRGEWCKVDVGNDWSLDHVSDTRDRDNRDTTVH